MKDKYKQGIEYIEVTKERYNYVKSKFKYISLNSDHEKHYYLARNRKTLDDKLEEQKPYWESLI